MLRTLTLTIIFLCTCSAQTFAQEARAALWSEETIEQDVFVPQTVQEEDAPLALSSRLPQKNSYSSNAHIAKKQQGSKVDKPTLKSVSKKKYITLQKRHIKTLLQKLHKRKQRRDFTMRKNVSNAESIFGNIGGILLILSFFLLVRLKLQTLQLFFIGLYLLLGSLLIFWIIRANAKGESKAKKTMIAIFSFILLLPALIGTFILFLGLFGYLGVVWQANALFNLLGFIFLGVGILIITLLSLLAD
ncbi:MAG: hypothetical protein AAF734_01790 [Bacteroidota bacterium]